MVCVVSSTSVLHMSMSIQEEGSLLKVDKKILSSFFLLIKFLLGLGTQSLSLVGVAC